METKHHLKSKSWTLNIRVNMSQRWRALTIKGIGSDGEAITMLRFKTNKRTSISFGFESSSSFLLEKEGFKIVGFHGKASNMIHQLGVHVMPITH
ncbi:putative jacalin-like lectin domain-containing protein [Arabidopsis thaliana]|uniref:Jacalin-type lectin domain-containing protein n=1 Tax=Arabidopsis thaliana TaxID=3702 RepID=A0A178WAK4_ARATH|nr:hypothetical protein AXX17_AT1G54380 [Arabidopsis thaliana]